jgi:hypothetical protein
MSTIKRNLLASKLAEALNLSPDTVGRYAKSGLIPFEKTPGGHRRYNLGEVQLALASMVSSSVDRLRLPGEVIVDRLVLGPKAKVSPSAKLRNSLRATRTTPMAGEEVPTPPRHADALSDLLENSRRILVSQ